MDCIFCKIAAGQIDSDIVYHDEDITVFKDTDPQAPVHLLAIPNDHIASANEIGRDNSQLIGKIFQTIPQIAKDQGFAEDGYRVVNNCGKNGGQTVGHIHFHILAGRNLQWPPG